MRRVLALALAAWAGAATAQVQTDADGLREIAARLLVQGDAERAEELALALLARDEDDVGGAGDRQQLGGPLDDSQRQRPAGGDSAVGPSGQAPLGPAGSGSGSGLGPRRRRITR